MKINLDNVKYVRADIVTGTRVHIAIHETYWWFVFLIFVQVGVSLLFFSLKKNLIDLFFFMSGFYLCKGCHTSVKSVFIFKVSELSGNLGICQGKMKSLDLRVKN